MKRQKCSSCNGLGEIEIRETEDERFYNEIAEPLLDKAHDLPIWCWWTYDAKKVRQSSAYLKFMGII